MSQRIATQVTGKRTWDSSVLGLPACLGLAITTELTGGSLTPWLRGHSSRAGGFPLRYLCMAYIGTSYCVKYAQVLASHRGPWWLKIITWYFLRVVVCNKRNGSQAKIISTRMFQHHCLLIPRFVIPVEPKTVACVGRGVSYSVVDCRLKLVSCLSACCSLPMPLVANIELHREFPWRGWSAQPTGSASTVGWVATGWALVFAIV